MNPARQAGIGAELPVAVPALTVNRVCGSGAQTVVSAALEIWAGSFDAEITPVEIPGRKGPRRSGYDQAS
ncbi:MAG TPA: hypothetical protein VK991_03475 [Halomonas sp.]|nr:hypothetical protein [Halomonas sp.]